MAKGGNDPARAAASEAARAASEARKLAAAKARAATNNANSLFQSANTQDSILQQKADYDTSQPAFVDNNLFADTREEIRAIGQIQQGKDLSKGLQNALGNSQAVNNAQSQFELNMGNVQKEAAARASRLAASPGELSKWANNNFFDDRYGTGTNKANNYQAIRSATLDELSKLGVNPDEYVRQQGLTKDQMASGKLVSDPNGSGFIPASMVGKSTDKNMTPWYQQALDRDAQAAAQSGVSQSTPTAKTSAQPLAQNTGIVPQAMQKTSPTAMAAKIPAPDKGNPPTLATGGNGGNGNNNGSGSGGNGGNGGGGSGTGTPTTGTGQTQITPGKPGKDPNAINVVDYAGQVAADPSLAFRGDDPSTPQNESQMLSDHLTSQEDIQKMTNEGLIDGDAEKYQMDFDKYDVEAQKVKNVKPQDANSYNVATSADKVAQNEMEAAQGQLSQGSQVDAAQIDNEAIYNQQNAVGKALAKYAAVDMSNIIDTSTAAGKLLAQQLGDGNYVDSKATLQGQLEILQSQFVDPVTGEPKIPSWAAATSRNVSKIAAFKGMTGTAATAAMSQALLEASIPIAQADSQFFQTLTIQNLNNKQQSIINTANTLAKFEQTNVDNRMAAAIQNSKSFLEMDMANLSNEQQERVINNQARVQSILEDSKQENAKRLFVAESQNEMDKFYDQLNTQINQYNSSQNLDAQKFNSTLADSREKFYKEMQYNIDISNAKWRQTVQLNEDQQAHEAATTDVKNMFDMQVNQLNQLWDRSDSMLDYVWKSSESAKDRKTQLMQAAMLAEAQADAAMMEGIGTVAGSLVGAGIPALTKLFG